MSRKTHSDSELVERFKNFDDAACLEELYHRYSHLVFCVCQKYLKNEEESRDATMEVFVKLMTKLRKHAIANFKSWLYAVVRNHCVTTVRNKNIRLAKMENFEESQKTSMENSSFERHYNNDDGLDNNNELEAEDSDLQRALTQLKDSQKTCIRLFYLEEKSYREIENLTGFEVKKVKSYIQNGKRNLHNILTQRRALRHA